MDNNLLFATASRQKFRFNSPQGQLSVEDLWDLPLTSPSGKNANLDDIARALHKQLKEFDGETISFVKPASSNKAKTEELQAKFDITKFVIDAKVAERDAAALAQEKKEKKQKLLELLDKKKNAELEGKSTAEIEAMLKDL